MYSYVAAQVSAFVTKYVARCKSLSCRAHCRKSLGVNSLSNDPWQRCKLLRQARLAAVCQSALHRAYEIAALERQPATQPAQVSAPDLVLPTTFDRASHIVQTVHHQTLASQQHRRMPLPPKIQARAAQTQIMCRVPKHKEITDASSLNTYSSQTASGQERFHSSQTAGGLPAHERPMRTYRRDPSEK